MILKDQFFIQNLMFEKEWVRNVSNCSLPIFPDSVVLTALNNSSYSTSPPRAVNLGKSHHLSFFVCKKVMVIPFEGS